MKRLAAGLLLLTGCSSAEPTPPSPSPTPPSQPAERIGPPVPLDTWIDDALWPAELDRAALVARIGAPARVTTRPQTNRHDPAVTDSVVVLEYDDARFVYYVVTSGPTDLLDAAAIRSDAYLRHSPPGIGTPADSLRAWWGPPIAATEHSVEYDCLTCPVPQPATFAIEDGVVGEIRFDLYVD